MTLIAAIIARLTRDTAFDASVKGRVGSSVDQGGVPSVRVTIVSDPRPQTFKGVQSVRRTDAQIDTWALTAESAEEIGEAAIAILTPPATVGTIRFQRGTVTNVRHTREQEKGDGVKRGLIALHRTSVDISLWHNG